MKKIFKLASISLIALSSSVFAHDGKVDSKGGHECEAYNVKDKVCSGYHLHTENESGPTTEEVSPIKSSFDYHQKSDYLTFKNYMKYKKIKERIDGKEVVSVVLMKRLSDAQVSRFSKHILLATKQKSLNLYLQEQSRKEDKILIEGDKEREQVDSTLKGRSPWAVYSNKGLVISGLSLSDYKLLSSKTADQKGVLMGSWLDGEKKLKYEIYEKESGYVLASINMESILIEDITLEEKGDKFKFQTKSMTENLEYYLFPHIGNNVVEYWKDEKIQYEMKKIKKQFN